MTFDKVLQRTPMMAREPHHMKYYGVCHNYYDAVPPGVHKFINEHEKINNDPAYRDFSYYINELGFRGHYPEQHQDNIMGFFGCSMTFGQGLADDETFASKISQKHNYNCLNLGLSGASNRHISLIFSAASRIWRMHTALVTLPSWYRTLYIDPDGNIKNVHMVGSFENDEPAKIISRLSNDHWLAHDAAECISNIVTTAKMSGINLILTSWDVQMCELIKKLTNYNAPRFELWDKTQFPGPGDYARDRSHPGVNLVDRFVGSVNYYIENKFFVPLEQP